MEEQKVNKNLPISEWKKGHVFWGVYFKIADELFSIDQAELIDIIGNDIFVFKAYLQKYKKLNEEECKEITTKGKSLLGDTYYYYKEQSALNYFNDFYIWLSTEAVSHIEIRKHQIVCYSLDPEQSPITNFDPNYKMTREKMTELMKGIDLNDSTTWCGTCAKMSPKERAKVKEVENILLKKDK